MRKLPTETRAAILTALVEGCTIASTSRMFSVSKVTILRLLADAGTLAKRYHDVMVRDLETKRVEMDEMWSYVYCHDRAVQPKDWGKRVGSSWLWVAIDADSKLALSWLVSGGRDSMIAREFLADVESRINGRIQLSSDGLRSYENTVPAAFGAKGVDYGQVIKEYRATKDRGPAARYSPGECIGCRKEPVLGAPDERLISTSYAERQNLTVRMQNKRFARLTLGYSKRFENHEHAVALHYFHYNFVRVHHTIKTAPAVHAGIISKPCTMRDFVTMLEREEERIGGRITDYKPAASVKAKKAEA